MITVHRIVNDHIFSLSLLPTHGVIIKKLKTIVVRLFFSTFVGTRNIIQIILNNLLVQ